MKIVNTGNTYEAFDDSLKVYDQLPPRCYIVRFHPKRGFWLEGYSDIEVNEDKVYGVSTQKVDKVLKSFGQFQRNLGVILSGKKGIGKSLFSKQLAQKAVEQGLPVVVVDGYNPGIASYLETIEQEVLVLFDEFDKTFAEVKAEDGTAQAQTEMLTLFDGISQGKKLFVITCNNLHKLNDYLVNRPGRFHYHFRFECPSKEEIEEYLHDKVDEQYYGEIPAVVEFSQKVELNYDCLRSIAFELNTGATFSEAIEDLNIINTEGQQYTVLLKYENGDVFQSHKGLRFNLFDLERTEDLYVYPKQECSISSIEVAYDMMDVITDKMSGLSVVPKEKLRITYGDMYDDEDEAIKEAKQKYKDIACTLYFIRSKEQGIHYAL